MERERKEKNVIIIALVVVIVSLTVAFAASLTQTLRINGTTNIASAKWDVYFKSATTSETSTVTPTAGPSISGKTTVTYTINLSEGKSFVLDTVIANGGTYNAKLNNLTLAGAENYDGLITYTSSGINVNDVIDAGSEENLSVTVSMRSITNDNVGLLGEGNQLTLTLVAEFIQAE